MIHSSGSRFQKYSPEIRNPGDEGLPYVKNARKTRILSVVALLHAGVLLLPLLFMIVKERTKKVPLYVYGPAWACGGAVITGMIWLLTSWL